VDRARLREAAERVAARVLSAASGLAGTPERGRPGRVAGTRELVLPPLPYIVVYAVEEHPAAGSGARVVVLRVLHGAMRWPPRAGPG
jgi:toxin ParE1/3/4